MPRTDSAYGLAVLLSEIAEKMSVYTFSDSCIRIPPPGGFALRDAMESSQRHGGTRPGAALDSVREQYDRIIVITDEQSYDRVGTPRDSGYMIKSPAREMVLATAHGHTLMVSAKSSSTMFASWNRRNCRSYRRAIAGGAELQNKTAESIHSPPFLLTEGKNQGFRNSISAGTPSCEVHPD
jgi:hypothetical protein